MKLIGHEGSYGIACKYRTEDFKIEWWWCCKNKIHSKAHTSIVLVISMVKTKFKNRTLRKLSECI